MLRRMLVASVIIASTVSVGSANGATTIDFDSLPVGTVVTNQYSPQLSISLLGSPPIPGPVTWALVDPNGNYQNIFGATGNAIVPNVTVLPPYYDLEFTFNGPLDYFSLMVIDAEEAFSARAYLGNNLIGSAISTYLGHYPVPYNGPVYRIEFGSVGASLLFDRVVVDIVNANTEASGPEFFDNLTFNFAPVSILIAIDIKPGNDTNSINICSGGKVPVAILGSAAFDVYTVDIDSLRFAGAAVSKVGGQNAKAQCGYKDVNEDGFVDLVCQFKTSDLGTVDGTLTGALLDGSAIEGSDTVNVFPESCPSPFGPLLQ